MESLNHLHLYFMQLLKMLSIRVNKVRKLNINYSVIEYSLGFHPTRVILGNTEEFPQNFLSLNPYQKMYVYTFILENEFVGDVKASLLRLVPFNFEIILI